MLLKIFFFGDKLLCQTPEERSQSCDSGRLLRPPGDLELGLIYQL
jgi:hypothetical protein